MMLKYDYLYCEIENKVAKLVFDNPPLNLFNLDVFNNFDHIMDELEEYVNNDRVRVIILTSTNPKAFSAGDDVKGGPTTADEALHQNNIARAVMAKIENFSTPVIAAIDGYALGGGAVLALNCDYRIATEKAKFAFSEIKFGMFPNWGTTFVLPKTISLPQAKKLLYTGEMITAQKALEISLVDEVVDQEDLMKTAEELAAKIAKMAPMGVRAQKTLLNSAQSMTYDAHYNIESTLTKVLFDSEDVAEGVAAFAEKREPIFKNR